MIKWRQIKAIYIYIYLLIQLLLGKEIVIFHLPIFSHYHMHPKSTHPT